jgi:ABC-type Fe3+-siderophore transport system permease subunit
MKHSLMWSLLTIFAIACVGLFGAVSQGPPGFGLADAQLMHTTYGAVIGATLFAVAIVSVGLGLLATRRELGGRLRPETIALLLLIASVLMARLASYISAWRRAFKGSVPESHYRNSRERCAGV